MLDVESARKIGLHACVDKIGRDFVRKHKDGCTPSWAVEPDEANRVFCYVGVDDKPYIAEKNPAVLILDETKFPYWASCNVNLLDGSVEFLDCMVPQAQ